MRTEGSGRRLLRSRGAGPFARSGRLIRGSDAATKDSNGPSYRRDACRCSASRAPARPPCSRSFASADPAAQAGDVLVALGVRRRGSSGPRRPARADPRTRRLRRRRRPGWSPSPGSIPRYPALLNCIADPPPVLWTRGRPRSSRGRRSRSSGPAPPHRTRSTWRSGWRGELAARGVVVVSGLARGVDSAAHRGTLEAGGPTVAVLGSGLDRVYPAEHGDLADTSASRALS